MKGERRLSLVRPPAGKEPASAGSDADEALLPSISAEETEAAEALAAALDRGQEPVFGALLAAYRPASLDEAAHEAILSRVLRGSHEPRSIDVPAEGAERVAADRLRAALDEHAAGSEPLEPEAELAGALRSAYRPREIAPLRNEALIAKALGRSRSRPARRIVPVTMAVLTGVTALAAGFALLFLRPHAELSTSAPSSAGAAHTPMNRSRSTMDLFDPVTPFARTGGQSARMDRIAGARAAELRENRFVAWGVQ